MQLRVEIRGTEAVFFRSCVKFNGAKHSPLFSQVAPRMAHGRFNENLYLDSDFSEISKNFKYQMRLSNITVWEHSLNFDSRKYELKWMSKRLGPNCFCISGLSEMRQILKSSCRMHPRVEVRGTEAIFFPLCSGLMRVGPRSALFFYLLHCRLLVRSPEWLMACLMKCCIVHSILPWCCKQRLQCERSLQQCFVCLRLSLHAELKVSLHHLFCYCCTATAHVGWRRVLRTPPHLPVLGRGVPQVKLKFE